MRLGIHNVRFFEAGDRHGLPYYAPYDRILVSAAAKQIPAELQAQLRVGGRMVLPINDTIEVINKPTSDTYETTIHQGFSFVPLV